MADQGSHSFPPVGDPQRLDSIMQRGRSLRRRRQLAAAGAGAGGALAVALVAVLVLGTGSGRDQDGQIVADDPSTTTTTTTTTTTIAPATTMTVEVLSGPPAQIRVEDPAQPVGDGTQQCLWVRVLRGTSTSDSDPAVAEGTACAPGLSTGGTADVAVLPTSSSESGTGPGAEVGTDLGIGPGVEIGCAASVVAPDPDAVTSTETRPGVTTFTLSAPDLPPGDHRVWVSATSGIGDGCAGDQGLPERENVAEGSGRVTLG